MLKINPCIDIIKRLQSNCYFSKSGISRSISHSVYCHIYHPGASFYAHKGIGESDTEIIMAVCAKDYIRIRRKCVCTCLHDSVHSFGVGGTHRITDRNSVGTGICGPVDQIDKMLFFRAGGINKSYLYGSIALAFDVFDSFLHPVQSNLRRILTPIGLHISAAVKTTMIYSCIAFERKINVFFPAILKSKSHNHHISIDVKRRQSLYILLGLCCFSRIKLYLRNATG